MTNNFNPKKGSGAQPPRLSPEEYKEKMKAEKQAVYKMLDDTASEVVQSPDKFKAYLGRAKPDGSLYGEQCPFDV